MSPSEIMASLQPRPSAGDDSPVPKNNRLFKKHYFKGISADYEEERLIDTIRNLVENKGL